MLYPGGTRAKAIGDASGIGAGRMDVSVGRRGEKKVSSFPFMPLTQLMRTMRLDLLGSTVAIRPAPIARGWHHSVLDRSLADSVVPPSTPRGGAEGGEGEGGAARRAPQHRDHYGDTMPHQTPGFLIGHVPYLCDHCVGGCQRSFASDPHLPLSAPRGGAEGGQGEGEGRQACAAAQTLTPLQPCSSASRSRICCPPTFPRPLQRCHPLGEHNVFL